MPVRGVLPAVAVCGITYAAVQFGVSNYIGPQLVDISSGLAAIVALVLLLQVWKPADEFHLEGETGATLELKSHSFKPALHAWSPYLLLVVLVLLWTTPWFKGTVLETVELLYSGQDSEDSEGGLARLYSGVSIALLVGPLSRFGDTARAARILRGAHS